MAKAVRKIASLGDHRSIPFDKLVLSQSNVRHIKRGISTEELAEDIARRGLLQNLNVRPLLDGGGKETGNYEVPAGGRRFLALQILVKSKRLAKAAPIPCNVREAGSPIPAEEDSLAENAQQVPLHPLDQFRAFKAQVDGGTGIEEVAARFFVTPTVVRQRLRLASVAPALLDIYAEDGMSLEQLMAFTVSADHERQLQVWDAIQRSPFRQPHYIRQALTEDSVAAADRRALFVGIDAYEAAGGTITRDLFEQDRGGWLDDVALIDRLANEKLAAQAQAIADEGWKWVEAALDFDYGHTMGLRRLHGRRPEPSEAEQKAHDARVDELDRLCAEHEGDDDVPDSVIERVEALEAAIEAFNYPELIYEPDEIARAGVFVSLGRDGGLRIERGFLRPEDEAPADPGEDGERTDAGGQPGSAGGGVTIGGAPLDEAEEADEGEALKPLSERLVTELTAWRTLALRDALAWDPVVAHLAVLHALVLSAFYHFGAESCLEIVAKSASFTGQAPGLAETEPAKAIDARHRFWAERLPDRAEGLWEALVALGDEERQVLFAHCASLSLNVTREPFNRRPRALEHGDVIARAVGLDLVAAGWRPSRDTYFDKVPKARILEAVREAQGEMAAQLIDHLKKSDMAREAERLLAGSGWLPEPLRMDPPITPDPDADAENDAVEALPAFLTGDESADDPAVEPEPAEAIAAE
jgi:ParB family chromosome partitioning protein